MKIPIQKCIVPEKKNGLKDNKEMSCLQNYEHDSLFGDDCFKEDIGR